MGCRKLWQCSFFEQPNMQNLEGLSSLFKTRYCNADHERCARYQVHQKLGSSAVPTEMRPNDHKQAESILSRLTIA